MSRSRLTQVLATLGLALLILVSGSVSGKAGRQQTSLEPPTTFTLSARQAEEVSVAVRFIDAFNRRQLRVALALLTRSDDVSD